jgi:hypothetical protein
MAGADGQADDDTPNGFHSSSHGQMNGAQPGADHNSTWQVFTQAVMACWQHHPVQVAVDIGRPFLNNYARDKPLQLLGIAAAVGVAAVFVKPWRLVSIAGLAAAALKSTNLSATVLSLLPRAAPQGYSKQTQNPTKDTL